MPRPTYVTRSDYLEFSGIDLQTELKGAATDNPSDYPDIFIVRVEGWLLEYLNAKYAVTTSHDYWDSEVFKKAILHQIDYLRKNGDLSIRALSEGCPLAPNAFNVLKMAGMANIADPRIPDTYGVL